MKVLLFEGYGDYDAVGFEKLDLELLPLWNKCKNEGFDFLDIDGVEGDVKAYEFENVDTKFIDFIRNNIQNYTSSKQYNFYIVEERE